MASCLDCMHCCRCVLRTIGGTQNHLPSPIEARTLLPGDTFTLQCIYDTSRRKNLTRAGIATKDEVRSKPAAWCLPLSLNNPRKRQAKGLVGSMIINSSAATQRCHHIAAVHDASSCSLLCGSGAAEPIGTAYLFLFGCANVVQ